MNSSSVRSPQPNAEQSIDLVNVPRLQEWLRERLPELGRDQIAASWLSGGASNAVFKLTCGPHAMVLRRPPRVPRPDSLKIIAREARVLAALKGTAVPHPRFRIYCEDADVIGAPFYLMDFVDGFIGHPDPPPPFDVPGPERRAMAFALVDGIAELAQVDYLAVGLEGFGKPDGFLARQVDRWTAQMASYAESENYPGREMPGWDYMRDWLRANVPPMSTTGIIHGDYSFANAIFDRKPPARLAAMIDWELSTIGDPLLDLGWVLYGFNGRDQKEPAAGYFDATDFPYREELAEYYAERTGRSIEHLTYYMVLAQFKLIAIIERHVARAQNGKGDREKGAIMADWLLRVAAQGGAMARAAG